jgi:uncharacterized membrane-anchored protein
MNALRSRWRAAGLRARTLLLLSVSTIFLLGMAGCEHMKRITGEEIILRTRPVDPREILRGNYVALDYEVEKVHLPDLPAPVDPSGWKQGDILYLMLRPDGVSWKPVGLSRQHVKGEPGDVALLAKYLRREDYAGVTEPGKNMPVDILLDIGVDHYYAAEKAAKQIEADAREAPLDVILSVGGDGHAAIKGLVINGEKRYETFF